MAQAIFSSNISYTPGGGGSLTQSLNVTASYTAINSGTLDVASGTAPSVALDIPFGSVSAARGFVLRNNTPVNLKVHANGAGLPDNNTVFLQVPPGGVVLYCSPAAPATGGSHIPLSSVRMYPLDTLGGPGTIDYITLGE